LNGISLSTTTSGMNLTDKLLRLRTERGLTIQQVADGLGLHKTQYDRYERGGGGESGTRGPTYERVLRLARYYKVPIEWLCDDEQGWPPPIGSTEVEQAIWVAVRRLGPERALDRLMGFEGGNGGQAAGGNPQGGQNPPGTMSLEKGPHRPRISRPDRKRG
jgi:transcriptional regulator with XRE-family HTH domain